MMTRGTRAGLRLVALMFLAKLSPALAQTGTGVIVFDGDSVSAGVCASRGEGPDSQLQRLLAAPARIVNVAAGGQPVFGSLANYPTKVAPAFDRSATFDVIAFHAGDNDVAQGRTAAETYDSFTRYVALAHAQGWRIVVSTELSRLDFSPARRDELADYNRRLLANTAGADAVIDYAGSPEMSDAAPRDGSAFYCRDNLHPSDLGYTALARLLAEVINPLTGQGR